LKGEKNIENGFYSNDLESEFKKDSWRCLYVVTFAPLMHWI
jgi:hypothetical protein